MSVTQSIPPAPELLYCRSCDLISPGDPDIQWYSWTSPLGKEVFCSSCLADPGQHWGEELYLLRLASFGQGSPEHINSLLDQVGARHESKYERGPESFINSVSNPVAQSSHTRYKYLPLGTDPDHIRLLCLHPSTNYDARVECSIEVVEFGREYSDFIAVSYAWGDLQGDKLEIFVEDSHDHWASVEVLQNLHHLLLHMRSPKSVRRLWVDALCINQGQDDEAISERNAQLNLMGRIYRQASNVTIWLGLEEDDSSYVIESIQARDIAQMQSGRFWKGMACIVRRPWFQRTWIIQELALNEKSPQVACGYQQISWTRLMAGFSFMSSVLPEPDGFDEATRSSFHYLHEALEISNLHILSAIRTHAKTDGGAIIERPIYRLLLRSRNFQASDARDRVYGLRGLMSRRLLPELPVDYKKPVEHTYQDAVQFMLKHEEGVQLFTQFALPLSLGGKTASWPSWVPDFNSTGKGFQTASGDADWYYRYPFRPFDFVIQTRGSRHHPQGPKPAVNANFQGQKLITQGICIDTISNLAKSKICLGHDYSASSEHQTLLEELEILNGQHEALKSSIDTLHLLIQRAGAFITPHFQDVQRTYLSGLALEERTRLRVIEILKRARIALLREETLEMLELFKETPLDERRFERVQRIGEITSQAANIYFDKVKTDIKSSTMSNEDKEATLSLLVHSIEQGDIWKTPIEPLSGTEVAALSEQLNTLSSIPIVPGADVMNFVDKLLDLTGQFMVMGRQQNAIISKFGQLFSKMKDVQAKLNTYLISLIESLAAVDDVYTRSLLGLPNDEWATELWHTLLYGYDNLKDLSREGFRQAFFDMVGSISPPALGSVGPGVNAPRSNQPLASQLSRALRHVFHEETQFFVCQRTKIYGLTTAVAKEGDVLVFLFPPWFMPMVLRRVEDGLEDEYHMVGPALLPSERRMVMLRRYKSFGLLQEKKLSTFSIV